MNILVILLLFDKYKSDYTRIKHILEQTGLSNTFDYDTLLKIYFTPENIPTFLSCFTPVFSEELLVCFAGYPNKPFNCTNYLTNYYLKDAQKQTQELSKCLSGKHFLGRLKGRLKNILYSTCKCQYDQDRAIENFYTAIWCSAACNSDIRDLSIKILYETVQRNPFFIKKIIDMFNDIEDDYIKDSLIYVLSCFENNEDIVCFFNGLLDDSRFVLAKSIKRMSSYFGKPYNYITLNKENLYVLRKTEISEDFKHILYRIDLMEKELLPFRFWGIENFHLYRRFLAVPKNDIMIFNTRLSNDYACVKTGVCKGWLGIEKEIEKKCSVSYGDNCLDDTTILSSLEIVFQRTFAKYGLPFERDQFIKQDDREFSASILRKCVCISVDTFFGSLMCNYYIDTFATYNNIQDSIGYEVFDPLEFGEELNIRSPLPFFQPAIEKMSDRIVSRIELPQKNDEEWWKDLDITKRNLLNLFKPFEFDGCEWVLLTCRISLRESQKDYKWKDTYDLYMCSSRDETINNDGNERHLTIETEDYIGNLLNYKYCTDNPWLCKSVPNIANSSDLFDETSLVLPPAEIISLLNLSLNLEEMCWYNDSGEKIICCNNNKASYYHNPITGAVFIRKDAYEELLKLIHIKYFAFAERFLENRGFCPDSAFHFEIVNNRITKEYPNYISGDLPHDPPIPQGCINCKYGFYSPEKSKLDFEELLRIIEECEY